MSIEELNKEQLTELKQNYYCNVVKESEGVSYGELADLDNLVSDKEIKEYYSNTDFSSDDFLIESNDGYDYYYVPDDSANIIIGLILNHEYSSKDTIQGLIYDLEKIKEERY